MSFTSSQLTEKHILQLIGTIELSNSMISVVLLYKSLEDLTWNETGDLSKNILTFVHNHCG